METELARALRSRNRKRLIAALLIGGLVVGLILFRDFDSSADAFVDAFARGDDEAFESMAHPDLLRELPPAEFVKLTDSVSKRLGKLVGKERVRIGFHNITCYAVYELQYEHGRLELEVRATWGGKLNSLKYQIE